jgi:plastocyanin
MEVSIENFSFSPADLKIPVGTKVVWTNKDTTAHTVTSDNKLLNSKLLEQGQKFEFTFNEAGTVEYYCVPHPFMKGKITVTSK